VASETFLFDQARAGAFRPSADHWSDHTIGRSIRRLAPKATRKSTVDRGFDQGGRKEGGNRLRQATEMSGYSGREEIAPVQGDCVGFS
jgi:hypothetical protein